MTAQTATIRFISTPEELDTIASLVSGGADRLILLFGDLGSGKTTLTKSLVKALGSDDEVSSPTFSLVNEYRDQANLPIFHIDLYRLNTLDEALQIGIEEYLATDGWCIIEWPEIIAPIMQSMPHCTIDISIEPDGRRRIRILK